MENIKHSEKFCFSYVRFSTKSQQEGSTDYRQDETFERVVAEYGWTPRTDLKIRLAGVSAFKQGGKNLPYLRKVIESVKDGTIPQGTVMIIETFDRYSRRKLSEVFPLLWEMLASGLEIWVEEMHLTKDTLDDEEKLSKVMREIKNAYKYSDKLSNRVNVALKKRTELIMSGERFMVVKGETKRIILNHLPNWIDKNKWEVNPSGKVIEKIFQMYLSGVGPNQIARKLNSDKIPTVTGEGTWGQGYIYRLLSNRQLIGEYRINGYTLKGYLPSVVSDETFLKVSAKMDDNKGKIKKNNYKRTEDGAYYFEYVNGKSEPIIDKVTLTGARPSNHNLFSGVAYCVCGEKIRVQPGKGGKYMDCYGHHKGSNTCKIPMVKYDRLESSFVKLLRLKADELVQDESGNTVNTHIQILKGQLSEVTKEANHITSLGMGLTKRLMLRQTELERMEEELTRKIESESAKTVTVKGSTDRLNKIIKQLETLTTDNELRVTVRGWIFENINRMVVNRSEKTYSVDFKNGQYITMNMDGTVIACKSFVELFGQNTVNLTESYQQQTFKAS